MYRNYPNERPGFKQCADIVADSGLVYLDFEKAFDTVPLGRLGNHMELMTRHLNGLVPT